MVRRAVVDTPRSRGEHDPLMTSLHGFDRARPRRLDRADRHQRLWDEAVAAPRLQEPIVIGVDAGGLELGILDRAENLAAEARDVGVEHGGGDAVLVHGLQALGGVVARRGDLVPRLDVEVAVAVGNSAGPGDGPLGQDFAIDQPAVTAVGLALDAGAAPPPDSWGRRDIQRSGGSCTWSSEEMIGKSRAMSRAPSPASRRGVS